MIFMRKLSVLISLILLITGVPAQTGTPRNMPVVAANTTVMTGDGTVTSASFVTFTTNTLIMPTLPPSTTRAGYCDILWQESANTNSGTFGLNTNNTLTGLYIHGTQYYGSTTTSAYFLPPAVVTTATTTAFTASWPVVAANTTYQIHTEFTVSTNTKPQVITVYALTSAGTLTVKAGSSCAWLP
jgi:hypothetical protein